MNLEVLISAVNAEPKELLNKMRIASNAVLINQCGTDAKENVTLEDGKSIVTVISSSLKGVGNSRNCAIEAATGDVLLFSDDDIEYLDGYENLILEEFDKHPEADAMFFNVEVCPERRTYYNTEFKRTHFYNSGRYPAYSIAIRRKALVESGVRYSTLFGGGAEYSCGEDSLFIKNCLDKGIKMYANTTLIGREVPRDGGESTWFDGYTDKFFYDRGVLYHFLYGALASLWGFRFVYTKKDVMCQDIPWEKAYKLLRKGIKDAKKISFR